MAFSSTIEGEDNWGRWKIKYGTYTNGSGDTGGNIDTGLGNVMACFLHKTGNGTTTDLPVVNETFPHFAGPNVTIVTKDNEDGMWLAIEGQVIENQSAVSEVTVFDSTIVGNKKFVCGKIVDGGDGAVAADIRHVLSKIEGMILQTNDSSVIANAPAINETFPVPANQSGGVTIACTASKTYYFLAWGTSGGT